MVKNTRITQLHKDNKNGTRITQLQKDNKKMRFKNNTAEGRVSNYFTSTADLHKHNITTQG